MSSDVFKQSDLVYVQTKQTTTAHLLSIDDLEPLLHLATLCAPALLVGDQGDVRMFGDAVITCAAVDTLSVIVITQVII